MEDNLTGQTILGYEVYEKLGSGAFGTVYKVVKTNIAGQSVRALKHITIPTEQQYDAVLNSMGHDTMKTDDYFSKMLDSIVSEIKILGNLSGRDARHIIRYYENDIQIKDSPRKYDIYILMEYLTPLREYILNHRMTVRDVVKLGLDVLEGLRICHVNGVIHRDIKDDNIFVSANGDYIIGDFGVSKILDDSSRAESLKGTPVYLAPEVYFGGGGYTKSVDLYSLGIVLYRLLNYNRNPFLPRFPEQFYAEDEQIAFLNRLSGKAPELPMLGGDYIGRVIVKAVSDKEQRYKTVDEFTDALQKALKRTADAMLRQDISIDAYPNYSSTLSSDSLEAQTGTAIDKGYKILMVAGIAFVALLFGTFLFVFNRLIMAPQSSYDDIQQASEPEDCWITVEKDVIRVGETTDLAFEIEGHDCRSDDLLMWISEDTSIASVDDKGVVTGISAGTVTIVGKYDGHEAFITITVL